MTSLPNSFTSSGERTPLLVGVEGLGSPDIKHNHGHAHKDNAFSATEGASNDISFLIPCSGKNGHDNMHRGAASHQTERAKRKLIVACIICLFFLIGEFVGGFLANSLAIITDAAHLLSDFASFLISLLAIWFATRPSTAKLSYGWHRAEVMGAVLSVLIIWVLTGILVYNAVQRVISGEHKVNADIMLIVAACGVGVNIIMGLVLGHSHSHGHSHGGSHEHKTKRTISVSPSVKEHATDENVNVRAAFVHVIGDLFQSIGVLVAALIIKFKVRLLRFRFERGHT